MQEEESLIILLCVTSQHTPKVSQVLRLATEMDAEEEASFCVCETISNLICFYF